MRKRFLDRGTPSDDRCIRSEPIAPAQAALAGFERVLEAHRLGTTLHPDGVRWLESIDDRLHEVTASSMTLTEMSPVGARNPPVNCITIATGSRTSAATCISFPSVLMLRLYAPLAASAIAATVGRCASSRSSAVPFGCAARCAAAGGYFAAG